MEAVLRFVDHPDGGSSVPQLVLLDACDLAITLLEGEVRAVTGVVLSEEEKAAGSHVSLPPNLVDSALAMVRARTALNAHLRDFQEVLENR